MSTASISSSNLLRIQESIYEYWMYIWSWFRSNTHFLLYIGLYMACSTIYTESTRCSLFTGCSDPIGATVNRQSCTGWPVLCVLTNLPIPSRWIVSLNLAQKKCAPHKLSKKTMSMDMNGVPIPMTKKTVPKILDVCFPKTPPFFCPIWTSSKAQKSKTHPNPSSSAPRQVLRWCFRSVEVVWPWQRQATNVVRFVLGCFNAPFFVRSFFVWL